MFEGSGGGNVNEPIYNKDGSGGGKNYLTTNYL
jgi:hypothetical protein